MTSCKDCKDCFHYKLCGVFGYISPVKFCGFYTDRSRFLELSYKIGDIFYEPKRHQITEYQITKIVLTEFGLHYEVILKKGVAFRSIITSYNIGKIVFVTREEAEQALKLKTGDKNA